MKPVRLCTLTGALLFATSALAKLNICIVGGGPEASSNQTSLEKNVDYFRAVLKELNSAEAPQSLLFSDGGKGEHTVQYLLPEDEHFRFLAALSVVANPTHYRLPSNLAYRKSELTGIDTPATPTDLSNWFSKTGASIAANDQLLLYFTGHGGGDTARFSIPARNTTLSLWGGPAMPMRDFEKLLDKTDPAVTVMLVMVQCHSGGFANLIYNEGDPAKGFSKQVRFGFFSTTAPRLAAGCTSDIQGDDYREFSTGFFAGLSGMTRNGQPIPKPDYDHDGLTSYMDAFTYVLITSDTIDLPMTTSDQLLHDFSKFATVPTTVPTTASSQPTTATSQPTTADTRLLRADAQFAQINDVANVFEKEAIAGLKKVLNIDSADPVAAAKVLAAQLSQQSQTLNKDMRPMQTRVTDARTKLQRAVYFRWPELRDPWLPGSEKLRDPEHFQTLKKALDQLPEYTTFMQAFDAYVKSLDESEAIEKKWVKTQRLIERANIAILRSNLPLVAKPEVLEHFKQLQKLEAGVLKDGHV